MKSFIVICFLLLELMQNPIFAQDSWKPVKGSISTKWSSRVNPKNVLQEYPRPNLVRTEWKNLNGLWNYSLTKLEEKPNSFNKKILVPFPIESSLSGVKQTVNDSTLLWYNRTFKLPKSWKAKRILLHFEAVDWLTKIWINDNFIGDHKGGYDPFYFDITEFLTAKDEQNLTISVWDPTDKGNQPCGKQTTDPGGIFYTSTTGIWQTVWLEPVDSNYIENYNVISNIDKNEITFFIKPMKVDSLNKVNIIINKRTKIVNKYSGILINAITLKIKNPILWSPNDPFLYDFEIQLVKKNKIVDNITGYFGMRKVAIGNNNNGLPVILINNKFIFQNGPLDQGFWPDGIYTAPTDEALKSDIEIVKKLGFNMLRKHVKVEPRRFYYWCDKLGIFVWQDMPSGDKKIWPNEPDIVRSAESSEQYKIELKRMINTHFNHPSIIMWVPFNEGWGQFDTYNIVEYIKELDSSRLVDNASGWADRGAGDVYDTHNYPEPRLPEIQKDRAIVIGEFGGLGLKIKNHTWIDKNWGYVSFVNSEDLLSRYEDFYTTIWNYAKDSSLSAVVYTQLTDVETEVNGLLTYDRKVIKLDPNALQKINTNNFIRAPKIDPPGGFFNRGDKVVLTDHNNSSKIYYTIDGSEPKIYDTEYKNNITLTSDVIIKAKAFKDKMESRTVTAKFTKTDLTRPKYKYNYSKKYSGGGDFALVDGQLGTLNYNDGKWQGFEEEDLNVVIQFKKAKQINNVRINFLEDIDRWIFLPTTVECFISKNGTNFDSLNVIKLEQPNEYRETNIKTVSFKTKNLKFSYLKIIAKNIRKCPYWHNGKDGKAWLFVDEITTN